VLVSVARWPQMPPKQHDGFRWRPVHRPARHRAARGSAAGEQSVDDQPAAEASTAIAGCSPLDTIARLLWRPAYGTLFNEELEHNRALVGRTGSTLPPTTYRHRLKGRAAAAYDAKQRRRERDQLAIELHANNMRVWSPSLVARSISYFRITTSWMHSVETGQGRLASRPTTMKVMRCMRDVRPTPHWLCGEHVFVYGFDQTYEWIGMQKRGRLDVSRPGAGNGGSELVSS